MPTTMKKVHRSCLGALLLAAVCVVLPEAAAASPPEAVPLADWVQMDVGGGHACGVKASGRLFCWGRNNRGQLGDGNDPVDAAAPVEVAGGATDWAGVSAGAIHTCAVKTSGRLFCWGDAEAGQTGTGGYGYATTPQEVDGGRVDWVTVSAGSSHTCAKRQDGRLFCWGWDNHGQLGDGGPVDAEDFQPTPQAVTAPGVNWSTFSAGGRHTCGRRADGRLFCWGQDNYGQLGDGGASSGRSSPVQVAGGATNWRFVSAGSSHTCAGRATGRLYCWGHDRLGRLGNGGTDTNTGTPVEVAGGAVNWTAVSAGNEHTCARRGIGRLFCWGWDHFGQLGNGGPVEGPASGSPVLVAGGAVRWSAVSVGLWSSCGRRVSGALFCWGDDVYGTLGGGTAAAHSSPVAVQG